MEEDDRRERWKKGIEVADKVYGAGYSDVFKDGEKSPYIAQAVEHLFGRVWAMPSLSVREKRLLVLGATTMLGRADLIELQVAGALANDEFTDEQFEEMMVLLAFYAGMGNSTALYRGVQAAKANRQ